MSMTPRQQLQKRLEKMIPKGGELVSFKETGDKIIYGRSQFLTLEVIYKKDGQDFRFKLKGTKL